MNTYDTSGLTVPDMVNDKAWRRDEEIVYAVESVAHRWGVDGVVGRSTTSLLDHLEHNERTMWQVCTGPEILSGMTALRYHLI